MHIDLDKECIMSRYPTLLTPSIWVLPSCATAY